MIYNEEQYNNISHQFEAVCINIELIIICNLLRGSLAELFLPRFYIFGQIM